MGAYASIPLQTITPIEAQTKAATLGNLLQEQQLRKQQIQEAQMRTQEMQAQAQKAQQIQQDAATWTDKFYQNNGDYAKTLADPDIQRIHPELYGKLADQYQQIRDRAAIASKSELQTQNAQHEALGGMLENALSLPDAQRVQQWPQIRQDAIKTGYAKPEEVPETDPGRPWLEAHRYYGMGAENVLKTEIARRTAKEESDKRAADLAHANVMNPFLEREAGAKATSEELGLTGRIAGAMAPPVTTLGGAATPVASAQPAAATATTAPIAGQGAPTGTNVSQNRLNMAPAAVAPPTEAAPAASTSARSPQWTQDKQDAWDAMRKLVPAGALQYLPPVWSPQAQATAQRLGLTAEQQAVNARERRAAATTGQPKTAAEFAAAMTDPTKTPEERQRWKDAFNAVENKGFTEPQINGAVRQMDTLGKQIEDLQEKERKEWELRSHYADLLDVSVTPADTEQVYDPRSGRPVNHFTAEVDKNGKVTKPGAGRVRLQQQYEQTEANANGFARKAAALRDQATEVRKRFGFGEFGGPGGGAPAAAAVAPKSWNVGGRTFTEGEIIYSKGRAMKVLGIENGKINAQPLQ